MTTEAQVRKIVMQRIKSFKKCVAFSFILEILIQLIALIPPLAMRRIIDVYLPEKDAARTAAGILVCVVVPLLSTLLTTFYNYKLNAVGRNMGAELTLLAGEKLIYQPVSFFQDKKSSELASYCSSESMKYIVFWLFDMPELAASLITGVVIYFYILNASLISGLVLLLYIPMMLLPSNYFAKKAQSLIRQVVTNNGKTSQLLNDTFRGIKFVKASVLEKLRLDKLRRVNEETVSVWTKMVVLDNLSGMWTNSIMDKLFTGIVFGIATMSVIFGNATVGILLVLLNYLPLLFDVVRKAANTNFKFKKQLAEYDRLFEMVVMPDEELCGVLRKVGLEALLDSREGGLDCVIGENGVALSGGQKQRIGLAQGLLRGSRVLLLDEVTANVDHKLEDDIRELIRGLQKEQGLTVISISHRMNFLNEADKIYELKGGRLSECEGNAFISVS